MKASKMGKHDDSTQDGDACYYANPKSRLYLSKVNATFNAFPSATSQQRRTYADNIFAHVIGHSLGLGHEPCSSAPGGGQLMDPAACQGGLNNTQWFAASVTQFEISALHAYQPD